MGLGHRGLSPASGFAHFSGIFSLDDRPVRESERQASRLHFASEEESLSSERSFPAGFIVGR